jgi:hypothetical protein
MSADPARVEKLADYLTEVLSECFDFENVNASDVISAQFTVLDRSLRGIRKLQDPSERFDNAREIGRILNEMLIEYGRVPS